MIINKDIYVGDTGLKLSDNQWTKKAVSLTTGNSQDSGTCNFWTNNYLKLCYFEFTITTSAYSGVSGAFYSELTPQNEFYNVDMPFITSNFNVGNAQLRADGGIRIYCNNTAGTFRGSGFFAFK